MPDQRARPRASESVSAMQGRVVARAAMERTRRDMSSKDAPAQKLFHAPEVVAALPACDLAPDPGTLLVGRAEVDAAPDAGFDDLL